MKYFWIYFAAGSALIIWLSWAVSIRARRYHGIARFFAFESILALFLLNVRVWFHDPWSALQILSWILLSGSILLAAGSISLYLKFAVPRGQFENSTRLVETGIYRFIRHPMYGSLMLLGLGIFLKRVTALTSALAFVVVLALCLTALIEEGEMRARFGEDYTAYRRRTKTFIPFLL
ncbi:MAG: isoprenylcysteine carboxylmethyltransferase family protein [Candidatus Aminicenantes bacterium]|nr:isoprenylcysteine carboxylmethyltransferase family protein [Candidatus Aminicenantes bacterium]